MTTSARKLALALALALILGPTSSVALAQEPPLNINAAAPYGTAGCGLGSMLFGAKPGITQIFAATTNASFGTQTFGITSGTSNCVDAPSASGATAAFVETNRQTLAKDIAKGSGETIVTLASLAGCAETVSVGRSLQARFGTIFPSATTSDRQVSTQVVGILRSDRSLKCGKLN